MLALFDYFGVSDAIYKEIVDGFVAGKASPTAATQDRVTPDTGLIEATKCI